MDLLGLRLIAGSGHTGHRHGSSDESRSRGWAAKIHGSNANLDIAMVFSCTGKGQPAEPLETLDQVGDGQLSEAESLIRANEIVIENGKLDNILILRLGAHFEGLVPFRAQSLLLLMGLLNLATPMVLMTNLDSAKENNPCQREQRTLKFCNPELTFGNSKAQIKM